MQFIPGGPDIPERLLQSHADGRVVFFCGAGISYPAGLPGFSDLVKQIFEAIGEPSDTVQAAIKAKQFDTAIGLLEANTVGGREKVRRELATILTPATYTKNTIATHAALLTLGKNRDGFTHLVTTNFDRLFEQTIADNEPELQRFQAPLLPVPKPRWDGLVYLHGLLTPLPTPNDLNQLVVSSGDFGLAYLTDRWASRFVGELLRNYTVCFVGYSIDDPILRYMMDALAADRLLGESSREMFAFGSYSKNQQEERKREWTAKNVTPILYREHNKHALLHKTLRTWANDHRDGVRGKERIAMECALAHPTTSTENYDLTDRLVWALRDPLPAKRFANHHPAAPLDWLEVLYKHGHSKDASNENPAPDLTGEQPVDTSHPGMVLAALANPCGQWSNTSDHLAHWLVRHLDNPKLVLWIVNRGSRLHAEFKHSIESQLNKLAKLKQEGKTDELKQIRANAPNALPRPLMRTLWRLVLAERVKLSDHDSDLYDWRDRLKRDGWTLTLKFKLREALSPCVSLQEPLLKGLLLADNVSRPECMRDIVESKVVLSADYVYFLLQIISKERGWNEMLPTLLSDFSLLLRDALDLMRELGQTSDTHDMSVWDQPSISDHPQNTRSDNWTALIYLNRDAWLAAARQYPERARRAAESWQQESYPLFQRLAFFAAAQGTVIPPHQALDWLSTDQYWWLWPDATRREVIRLLSALAPRWTQSQMVEIVRAILTGPPRAMFKSDLDLERWEEIVNHSVWFRLAKINATGAQLGDAGQNRLNELSGRYPQWQLETDETDEFAFWIDSSNKGLKYSATPRRRRDLITWLKQHPDAYYWIEDDWHQLCCDSFPTTACALCALAKENIWPTDRWCSALQAWSNEKHGKRAWRHLASLIASAPPDVFQKLTYAVSFWLRAVAETFDSNQFKDNQTVLHTLIERLLNVPFHDEVMDTDAPVARAINHPVGHATTVLLDWWHRGGLEDRQHLKAIFTRLCDRRNDQFRHGRVLLASRVSALFRADQSWTTQHLLPLFDWQRCEDEARAAWEGFFWSPRLYPSLAQAIKSYFLDTARYYQALKNKKQYAVLLTLVSLNLRDIFTKTELAEATRQLPPAGLHNCAWILFKSLEASGDQRADYWANRIVPYLRYIWPKSKDCLSPEIAENFGYLCIAAQNNFPDALSILGGWLQPLRHSGHIVHQLNQANLCPQFPRETLEFLGRLINEQTFSPFGKLGKCLKTIRQAEPALETDTQYNRLMDYVHQRNRS